MTTEGVVPYEMTLLQFTPKATSGERLNIGVAVFSPETKEGAFRLSERYGRLASLYPGFDGGSYRALIRHLRRRFREVLGGQDDREQRRLPADLNHIEDAIGFLSMIGNDNFLWSPVRYGICTDLQARTDELYGEFVLQLEGTPGRDRLGAIPTRLPPQHPSFMQMQREYVVREPDAFALADAYGLKRDDVAAAVGVTPRRLRDMVADPKHARRVRVAVLEIALQRERLAGMLS